MRKPNRLSLWLREAVCKLRGHTWEPFSRHSLGEVVSGRMCTVCGDFEGAHFEGQYPKPRPV